jgi:hypothetical protein
MNRKQFKYDVMVQKQNLSSEIQNIANKIQQLKNIHKNLVSDSKISDDVSVQFKCIEILQMIKKYTSLLKLLKSRELKSKPEENNILSRSKTRLINFDGRRSRSVGHKIRYDTPRYPINVKALKKIIDVDCMDGIYSVQKWLDTNLTDDIYNYEDLTNINFYDPIM